MKRRRKNKQREEEKEKKRIEESGERSLLFTLAIHNLKAEAEIDGCYFELMTSQRH